MDVFEPDQIPNNPPKKGIDYVGTRDPETAKNFEIMKGAVARISVHIVRLHDLRNISRKGSYLCPKVAGWRVGLGLPSDGRDYLRAEAAADYRHAV
jgi:hypothetical protein